MSIMLNKIFSYKYHAFLIHGKLFTILAKHSYSEHSVC